MYPWCVYIFTIYKFHLQFDVSSSFYLQLLIHASAEEQYLFGIKLSKNPIHNILSTTPNEQHWTSHRSGGRNEKKVFFFVFFPFFFRQPVTEKNKYTHM